MSDNMGPLHEILDEQSCHESYIGLLKAVQLSVQQLLAQVYREARLWQGQPPREDR